MNRNQPLIKQSPARQEAGVKLLGKAYTIAEAGVLAAAEQQRRNFQGALEIYNLILIQAPHYAEVHNNRGIALQALQRDADALASFDQAIALKPDYANAHNNRAATLKQMRRYEEALASFDKAIALKPDHANALNNRGATLKQLGRYEEALTSCDRALNLKPDYANAHHNRGVILQAMQRQAEALASYDKAIALKPDDADSYNNRGLAFQELKRYVEALASCDRAIALRPDHANAHNNRGAALHKLKRYDEALASYAKAIALDPNHAEFHNNRGITLQEVNWSGEALTCYDRAIALKPDFAEFHNNRGITLKTLRRFDEALASYDRAIALKPDYAESYNNRGLVWINKGRMEEAEKMFLKAFELRPDFPDPLCALTGIRKYKIADNPEVKNIQALLKNPAIPPDGKEYLYFSLGKIYDDCGLYDEAFESYRQANQIRNATVAFNADGIKAMTDAIIEMFSQDFLARPFAGSSDSQSPLFVVGMPRSGTTLMASILSNHHSIATAGELSTISEFASRLPALTGINVPYPQAAKQISPALATRLTNEYEQRLRRDCGSEFPHVVDKHPLNFWHLGFIAKLFPKARIIHCKRHPLDTGLSNYFQRFGLQYDYSFDLRNIGRFYCEYARLMEHWRSALPLNLIEINYQDMIVNTEQMTRQLLDYLGLEWDERCLTPHTNPCAVETASQWQVRQPIYHQSLERWRHYEKHLTPLKEILQLAGQMPA